MLTQMAVLRIKRQSKVLRTMASTQITCSSFPHIFGVGRLFLVLIDNRQKVFLKQQRNQNVAHLSFVLQCYWVSRIGQRSYST